MARTPEDGFPLLDNPGCCCRFSPDARTLHRLCTELDVTNQATMADATAPLTRISLRIRYHTGVLRWGRASPVWWKTVGALKRDEPVKSACLSDLTRSLLKSYFKFPWEVVPGVLH